MENRFRLLIVAGWCLLIAFAAMGVYGPQVFSELGFLSLIGGGSDTPYLWISMAWMAVQVVVLSALILSVYKIAKLDRRIPSIEFLLICWPSACGLTVSVKRAWFSTQGSDWVSILEPALVSVAIPLLLTLTGFCFLRVLPTSADPSKGETVEPLETLLIANIVGAAFLSFLLFLLALLGFWRPIHLAWVSLLILTLGTVVSIRKFKVDGDSGQTPAASSYRTWNLQTVFMNPSTYAWGLTLLLLFGIFHLCWLPPDDSDELRYHLTLPKRYLEAGGFVVLPDQLFSYFPTGMEMLMGIPLSLEGWRDEASRQGLVSGGKFVHAWMAFLCVGLLWVWIRDLKKEQDRMDIESVLPLLFLSIPFVPVLASWAFVDFGSSLGWIASGYFGWRYFYRGASKQDLLMAGISLGWSLQVKYTGLAWCFVYGIAWFLLVVSMKRNLLSMVPIVFIPLLLFSPWLLNNLVLTGNPFAPLLSGMFGFGFDPVQKAFYDWHAGMKGDLSGFRNLGVIEKVIDLFLLPFRAACDPSKFENNPIGGLIIFSFPCFVFGLWSKTKGIRWIGGLAFGAFLLWGLTYRDPRFAIPLWGYYFLIALLGWSQTLEGIRERFRGRVFGGLVLLLIFLGLSQSEELLKRCYAYGPVIVHRINPEDYLARRLPAMRATREVERLRSGEESKPNLLLLGQEQSYYFDSPVRGTDYFDGPFLANVAREATSVEAISQNIREQGIDWVFINRETLETHPANVVRGLWFTADPEKAVQAIERIGAGEQPSLTLDDGNKIPAFRRMHTWLIRHPGFKEVPLQSTVGKDRPLSEIYRQWMEWPEMKGVSVDDLPRTSYSLLVWEGVED